MNKYYKIVALKTKSGKGEQTYSFTLKAKDKKESYQKASELLSNRYMVDHLSYHLESTEL